MTRINVVPPECLSNKHLMAEYRELPRVFTAVKKLVEKGVPLNDVEIPDKYVLGEGHVKFFYNKLGYLINRYGKICRTLEARGFNLNPSLSYAIQGQAWNLYQEILISAIQKGVAPQQVEWYPSPDDIYLNMARLCNRTGLQPVIDELTQER